MIHSRILSHGSGFLLEVGGKRLPLYAYMSYQPSHASYDVMCRQGVQLFCAAVYAGDLGINPASGIRPFRPGFWRGPDEFDFSAAEEDFRRIVGDAAPGSVYLLPRLVLNPPLWWEKAHPEALARDFAGRPMRQSFSSPVWLEACRSVMARWQQWLTNSGWDRYVVGWHLAAGSTEEFLRPQLFPGQYGDYSDCATEAFRRWLAERYTTVSALNAAWKTTLPDFSAALPPTPARRQYAARGVLRDPAAEQAVIDYYRFYSESMAQSICALCRMAKQTTGRRQVVGAFYGYLVNVTDPDIGHHALALLLEEDSVDFLASPFTYPRPEDEDWPLQGPVDSAALHGKPWLMEADVRTHLSRPLSESMPQAAPLGNHRYDGGVWLGPETAGKSRDQMCKAFAKVLTGSLGVWWFDMWGGWYDDPELLAFLETARNLYSRALLSGDLRPTAELAVFADERCFARMRPQNPLSAALPDQLRQLGRVGAPYRFYLLSDLDRLSPADYRAAVFLLPHSLSDAQRDSIERWQSDGRTLCRLGKAETPLLLGPEDVVLSSDQNGEASVWLERRTDCQILHSTGLDVSHFLLREALQLSGLHIYAHTGDMIYANSNYIAISAASDGEKRLYLPERRDLRDVLTGEILPVAYAYVDFPMQRGETRLFENI